MVGYLVLLWDCLRLNEFRGYDMLFINWIQVGFLSNLKLAEFRRFWCTWSWRSYPLSISSLHRVPGFSNCDRYHHNSTGLNIFWLFSIYCDCYQYIVTVINILWPLSTISDRHQPIVGRENREDDGKKGVKRSPVNLALFPSFFSPFSSFLCFSFTRLH
jgi:hypothetical protein